MSSGVFGQQINRIDDEALRKAREQRQSLRGVRPQNVVEPHIPPESPFADMHQEPLARIATSTDMHKVSEKLRNQAAATFEERFGVSAENWLNQQTDPKGEYSSHGISGEVK